VPRSLIVVIAAVAALSLTLASCGTTEDPASASGPPTASSAGSSAGNSSAAVPSSEQTPSASVGDGSASSVISSAPAESSSPSSSASATGPITLTDGIGRAVRLDKPATRVVALEWGEAEMLVSLGVMPVGVADIEGYGTWDVAEKLDPSVKDVGTRAEPSIDAIVALGPDLVVMNGAGGASLADQLAKTVPVLVTTGADTSRQMDRLRDDVNLLAKATGTQDRAAVLLERMASTIAAGKAALGKAGADGTPFLIADGWMQGSAVAIRMFAKGSQMSDIAEALGLRNAWTKAGDKQWGLGQTDVEGLAGMTDPDLHLFYSASEEDVFADGLGKNPIWSSLPFVQKHQLTKLDKGTWTFGGPASVEFVVHQIVAAYAG